MKNSDLEEWGRRAAEWSAAYLASLEAACPATDAPERSACQPA